MQNILFQKKTATYIFTTLQHNIFSKICHQHFAVNLSVNWQCNPQCGGGGQEDQACPDPGFALEPPKEPLESTNYLQFYANLQSCISSPFVVHLCALFYQSVWRPDMWTMCSNYFAYSSTHHPFTYHQYWTRSLDLGNKSLLCPYLPVQWYEMCFEILIMWNGFILCWYSLNWNSNCAN